MAQAENAAVGKAAQEQPSEAELRRRAYAAGEKRLREAHRDEFLQYVQQEATALGVEYKPRPTAAEKAQAKLEALLTEHPELRAQLGQAPA